CHQGHVRTRPGAGPPRRRLRAGTPGAGASRATSHHPDLGAAGASQYAPEARPRRSRAGGRTRADRARRRRGGRARTAELDLRGRAHDGSERLITMCGLTDSSAVPNEWGTTRLSARDAVRMGDCIADGTAAGPTWTPWVLDMMRKVRGVGDFGIRDVLPPAQAAKVAIKN